jgi:hypothetical protein
VTFPHHSYEVHLDRSEEMCESWSKHGGGSIEKNRDTSMEINPHSIAGRHAQR